MPPSTFDVHWLQVEPQQFRGWQSQQWWAKDIRLAWPNVMFDDFLHVGEHWKPWERCRTEGTRDEVHGKVQLHIDLTCVSKAWPDWGTVLCCWIANSRAPEQMTTECWRWHPRWNWLASSTSCFSSSACLQSLSSTQPSCRTAYGLESPQDRLCGTQQLKPHYISSVADKRYRIAFCAANCSECNATAFSYRTNSDAK